MLLCYIILTHVDITQMFSVWYSYFLLRWSVPLSGPYRIAPVLRPDSPWFQFTCRYIESRMTISHRSYVSYLLFSGFVPTAAERLSYANVILKFAHKLPSTIYLVLSQICRDKTGSNEGALGGLLKKRKKGFPITILFDWWFDTYISPCRVGN